MVTAKKVAASSPAKKASAPTVKRSISRPAPVRPAAPAAGPLESVPAPSAKAKGIKTKKPKLVRDSFTIPKPEYELLDQLKRRSAKIGHTAKKSELLRAGIKALAAMPDAAFSSALAAVPAIKTGRPAST